ncbi:hypothetical protein ACVAMH_05520 [Bacillus zanthoxyli]
MPKDINEYRHEFQIVSLPEDQDFNSFECEIQDYSHFLKDMSLDFQKKQISHTHLLLHKQTKDIVAYMSLFTDNIILKPAEKDNHILGDIPFKCFPAMKIGKLAVNKFYKERYKGIGSFMINLARGLAVEINENGIACTFLTVDADIVNNPTVVEFYTKNQFKPNENYRNRDNILSMRLHLFTS